MQMDLKRVFDIPGESVAFSHELDLRDVEQWGRKPFASPVHVTGVVQNRAGIVEMEYSATFRMVTVCDRCLKEEEKDAQMRFSHILVQQLQEEDNDALIPAEGGMLDLDELVVSDVILELPIKTLCREDCKGLCPVCGKNLNEGSCHCQTKTVDPRLVVLQQLLDD